MTVHRFLDRLAETDLVARTGRVRRIMPTFIEADGPAAPRGALCRVETEGASREGGVFAQVVGVNANSVILVPFEETARTFSGARVEACAQMGVVPVGDGFLGRAVDALARPIDGGGPVRTDRFRPMATTPTGPLDRVSPRRVFETGVRAIDGLLTLGEGQRVGVFAASGVGKTSLMTQFAKQARFDRAVICLVGERGREVEAFWSDGLSSEARARATLVAATSDQAAAMRVRAGELALALAEHWREQGLHVLLLLDSITRLAMAMRELGLAAGEPPTVRAYTPSVFSAIPKLVERCGARRAGGAVTCIMTVLSETDDIDDPISEMLKSLLDGHIILSRSLAEQGQFPAIDVPRSLSRLAERLMDREQRAWARTAKAHLSAYDSSRTLIESGVYAKGSNAEIDQALERRPALLGFLRQPQTEYAPFATTRDALAVTAMGGGAK
jgi:flagellum-specific ATP synthase